MPSTKHRRKGKRSKQRSATSRVDELEVTETFDFETNPMMLFLNTTSFDDHLRAQMDHRARYIATVVQLVQMKIELLPSAKVKALACAWARKDSHMSDGFLSMKKVFNFVEVSKAVNLLDIPRQIKALEKKNERLLALQKEEKCVVKDSTFKHLARKIKLLSDKRVSVGSVSGCRARLVRRWIRTFNKEELEFMAMNFDSGVWRELADKVHFNPTEDFVHAPWFLSYCHGGVAPVESGLNEANRLTAENVNEVLKTTPLPFHKVSGLKEALTDESKAVVALHDDSVGRAIWWYEDLSCPAVDEVILGRLSTELDPGLGYGKLMERLMMLKPKGVPFYSRLMQIAERKLGDHKHQLEGLIGVFADASGSMEVAIKIATIVSSFLTVFTDAKLVFFNDHHWSPASNPSSISDVVDTALGTQASGSTAPAAALWPFYESKQHLKTIIMVTDEEENTKCHEHLFTELYIKYVAEVGPCRLIFISFLRGQHSKGQMVEQLRGAGVTVVQHVLSSVRPDISKLDSIISRMSLNPSGFLEMILPIEARISTQDNADVFMDTGN